MTAWKFISRVLLVSTILSGCCSTKSSDVNVCALWSENGKVSSELKDLIYVGVSPAGGTSAGRFSKVKVNRWEDCVSQCCQFERCNVAYWISSVCVHIECVSDELCAPMESRDNERNDENIYLKVRSVQSTAAAIDYDDPGRDECNATQACPVNERCEQVTVSAEIKRNVCSCDRKNDFRRINGVCRQYLPRGKPCAVYDKDYDLTDGADDDDQDRNGKRGRCGKNEDCLPPNDRAKHGYCQCRLGFQRDSDSGKCVVDEQVETSTVPISPARTTSISSSFDLDVEAGVDQTITWPISQVDLYGRALYKSNKSEVDVAALNNRNLSLSWSLKSSNNGAKIDLTNPGDSTSHIVVKQLREGVYEFELHLNDQQGLTLASDIVKVAVVSTTTTPSPLNVQITSPVNVRLPQQIVKLEARVEPANRHVTYQWTHGNDGPTTPILEDMDKPILTISNLRPGTYSFRLHVVDIFGNEQSKTVQIVATGEPIEAQVANRREVVFWPSTDVLLDGSSSIVEQQTAISWTLLSSDNKQHLSEVEISMPHSLKTRVSNLRIGQYKFQLTLATKDEEYVSKKDVLVIVYAQNGQPPKLALRLETTNVNIISNLIVLNASNTTADYGIDRWLWKKGPSSPAMGNFINDSDQSPVAYVTNLIEGTYVFTLQVFDDRQQMSESNITVAVRGLANAQDLIEILFASKPYLRQQTLDNLLAQIRVFLLDISSSIDIVMVGMPKENMLLIKGIDSKTNAVVSPKLVANHLQSKIKSLRSASNVDIASIDTYLCLSNCSNHGKCDQKTKRCVCNRYYMENWFKSLVHREPNCDFITHYFVAAAVSGLLFTIIFCWLCLCCCRRWRRRRNLLERRRRIRYQLLHEDEDDEDHDHLSPQSPLEKGRGKSRPMKKTKTKTSNVIISESDGDASDEHGEQTLYDKPLLTAKGRALKVPVQDSNGSPMLRNNGQSPTTTDNSMA